MCGSPFECRRVPKAAEDHRFKTDGFAATVDTQLAPRRQHRQSTGILPSYVHETFHRVYRQRMSTKHIRTISDVVRFGAGLRIDCTGCGATRTLGGFEAAKIAGGVSRLTALAQRLRCTRCGAKEARLVILPPV
jgi:hypothetical protein